MTALLLSGILVGLDNLQVTTGVGVLGLPRRRRALLVASFALCEAVMPLVGVLLGLRLRGTLGTAAEFVGPAAVAACGGVVLWGSRRAHHEPHLGSPADVRWPKMLLLPVMLSFDNLLVGTGLGTLGSPALATALVVGLVSAAMCTIGLTVGTTLRHRLRDTRPGHVEQWGGLYLLGLAVVMFLNGAG